ADLDRARIDGAELPVCNDHGADRGGGSQAFYGHRKLRDHGDPVLHSGGQFSYAWRGCAAGDPIRYIDGRPFVWRPLARPLAGVMACALFAAVSGSSPATVVAIGSIILPAMVQQGYPKRFGAGVIATSGALGILIPPSIVMVLYAVATGGSVAIDPEGKRVL